VNCSALIEVSACKRVDVLPAQVVAERAIVARVHEPARYSVRGSAPLVHVAVWPRAGSRAQPADYAVRVARVHGRWRVVAVSGGPRVCRQVVGGERDPDPGSTMLSC
jgi:hypothetical protein